jgi:hypothetical protein
MAERECLEVEEQVANKPRKATSVSQVLQAVSDENLTPSSWIVRSAEGATDFQIRVASDRAMREKAYALAYRVYRRCGYVNDDPTGLCVSAYDAYAGTFTLLAEDPNGKEAGTISLVFDSNLGLPCNEIYREEVDGLRAQGLSLVEFTRLAIDDDAPNARGLLFHLFALSYAFARCGGGCTDMLIEVNPRHVQYYKKILRFEQVGPERACPRVKGAPAVLMRMNFALMDAELSGHNAGRDRNGKRMHAYPFSPREEREVVNFLNGQHRTMTFADARFFNISRSTRPVLSV